MRSTLHIAGLVLAVAAGACRGRPDPDPSTLPAIELVPKADLDPALGLQPIEIPVGEYREAVARLRLLRSESLQAKRLPEALTEHVVEGMVRERLLAAEARRLKVRASTTAVAAELQALRTSYEAGELDRQLAETYQTKADLERRVEARLVQQALLEKAAFANLEVDDAAIAAAYEALAPEARRRPARVRAAQIVVDDEVEAERVHRVLTRGASFETLARTLSITPEASRGGHLGWVVLSDMPPVFATACGPLEVGQISAVTASTLGYHICKVLERAPEEALSLEQMKDRLRAERLAELRREAEARYIADLKSRYEIVRHPARMQLEN